MGIYKHINCLLPKVEGAVSWREFHPKVISKILSTRLNNMLPKLVSPWQMGFVPGRSITDYFVSLRISREVRKMVETSKCDTQTGYGKGL